MDEKVKTCVDGCAEGVGDGCEAVSEENIHVGICPYYKKELGRGRLRCEAANLSLPDKLARREFVYRFCAHPEGYRDCQLKVVMDHYYERKFAYHGEGE